MLKVYKQNIDCTDSHVLYVLPSKMLKQNTFLKMENQIKL